MGTPPKEFNPTKFDLFILDVVKENGPITDLAVFEIAMKNGVQNTPEERKRVYRTLNQLMYSELITHARYGEEWEYIVMTRLKRKKPKN